MKESYQPYDLDRTVRLLINCALAAGAFWLVYTLKGVLLPFCVAAFLAYLLEPAVQYNRRLLKLKGRVSAIFITLSESLLFLSALIYFLVPMIGSEMSHMSDLLTQYSRSADNAIPFIPESFHQFIRTHIDFDYLSSVLRNQEQLRLAESLIGYLWDFLSSGVVVIINVLSWFIVFLYVIFIMLDYEHLGATFRGMVPPRYRTVVFKLGRDVERSMNHYFRGQALIAFCVGVLFSIGFSIIGMPLAIVLGMFIGLLNMVPYLQLISFVPATLLCVVCSVDSGIDFWVIFLEMFAVYCIVQAIQDLYLTPRIMGKAMGLNPAIILLSLSVWGTLLGFLGLIIALPLTTLLLAYYDRYIVFLSLRDKRRAVSDHRSGEQKDKN
ncbi:MAG: AI-2E family transporter [Muribaculum sp.]|nr:AI-2E family transporter [Muribaculum sp.]